MARRIRTLDARLLALRAENAALKARLAYLESRVPHYPILGVLLTAKLPA